MGKENEITYPVSYHGVQFEESDAAKAFVRIAELFYRKNFGAASKSEIELEMFDIFVSAARVNNQMAPDLFVAKSLGITPQVVRNRKTKLALRRPEENHDWKTMLLEILTHRTYVLRDAKSGCEIKMMFPEKMGVYEFEDALLSHHHFFDNSFNNLVVVVSARAVIDVLFQDLANIKCPIGAQDQTVFGYIKWRLSSNGIDEDIRKAIETLWGGEAYDKAKRMASISAKEALNLIPALLDGPLSIRRFSKLFSRLNYSSSYILSHFKLMQKEVSKEKKKSFEDMLEGIKRLNKIFKQFGDFKNLSVDESSLCEDDLSVYKN